MSAQDNGGMAFPGFEYTEGRGPFKVVAGEVEGHAPGMSLRDYAAIKFTAALLSNPGLTNSSGAVDETGVKRASAFGLVAAEAYLKLRG